MLEIDLGPRQQRKKIEHRPLGCNGKPRKVGPIIWLKMTIKDKRYVGSLRDEGSMHVVCMTHEGASPLIILGGVRAH